MRGKAVLILDDVPGVGITPACAGKRNIPVLVNYHSGDHPRVCGEKPVAIHTRITSAGSPPRMRGKALRVRVAASRARITPAYAGKRPRPAHAAACHQDHPRVCGEKTPSLAVLGSASGSPPRMRGKGALRALRLFRRGITPAYAGKRCAG